MNTQADASMIEEANVIDEKPAMSGQVPENVWKYGLTVVIILILSNLALTLMAAAGVIQFFWMMFKKERNAQIVDLGSGIAHWLGQTATFVTGKSDSKPFPWGAWKA